MIRAFACTLGLLLAAAAAPAQQKTVFRCEAGGKVTYADAPCKGGAEVATDPTPSEAQRKAAREAVLREEQMAEKMARERHAAEAAAGRQRAAHIPHSAAEKAASVPAKPEGKKKKAKKAPPAAAPQS
jgi:Domain of unknown function (DUF4124)